MTLNKELTKDRLVNKLLSFWPKMYMGIEKYTQGIIKQFGFRINMFKRMISGFQTRYVKKNFKCKQVK